MLTIAPSCEHTHTVIFLHGRGSNAEEFRDDFFESTCSDGRTLPQHFPSIKWILPSAHQRYSTVFQESMSEWFDVYSLTDPESRQELQFQGIKESLDWICTIIQRETAWIPSKHIFLGGISQGCATAILAFLFRNLSLAGFIGISGWLPFRTQIEQIVHTGSNSMSPNAFADFLMRFATPQIDRTEHQDPSHAEIHEIVTSARGSAFLCHGLDDTIVDVSLGRAMRDTLLLLKLDVHWRADDDCGHWIKEPGAIDSIVTFIARHTTDT